MNSNTNKLKPELSIIIVSYNVYNKLLRCLRIVDKIINCEIIVVDNNSSDETIKKLTYNSFSKKIRLYKNQNNLGFARGANRGIRVAKGKFILLLNPDTIPNLKAIYNLLIFYKTNINNNLGLVGGRMIKPNHKGTHGTFVNKPSFFTALFDFTNLKKVFKNNKFTREFYYLDDQIKKEKVVYGLSGGFLLFSKSLIKKVGKFDKNYFMYLEDVDLGVRVREMGYLNYYLPQVSIIHESGSSSSNSKYRINVKAWRDSRNYYIKKHFNFIEKLILIPIFFFDSFIIDLIHRIKKEPLL